MSVPRQTRRALERAYARIPSVSCTGACWEACGPILMSEAEAERIGHPNDLRDQRCPLLGEDHRCTVHAERPAICRLYGVAENLLCPYGCEPERVLSRGQGADILSSIRRIGGAPALDGPVPSWLDDLAGGVE